MTERLQSSRRTALKLAGGTLAGGLAGMAGCLGIGSDGSTDSIGLALAPGGLSGIIMDYLENEDVLANEMEDAGYEIEVQRTYDDVTLFASGQIEFAYPGPIGAARIAAERDLEVSLLSKNVNMFPAWYTRPGSEFDPEEVGGLQAAIDNLAANGTFGTARWSAGTVPATQTIFQNYGYDLSREGGDVDLVIGGFEAMDQAVVDDQVDVATGSPMSGAAPDLIADPPAVSLVVQIIEEIKNIGLGRPAINSWASSPDFLESDREAAEALLAAWDDGVSWFYDNAESIIGDEDNWENISVDSEEAAQFVYEWGIENQHELKEPIVVEDFRWNDQTVSDSTNFLEQVEELGQLSSGWQDRVHYVQDI